MPFITEPLLTHAGATPADAALYAAPLAASCARRGVTTPSDTANLLAEIMNESGNLSCVHECMSYTTASRICAVFPSHFRSVSSALPYVRQPRRLGDYVYASLGGYDARGAGLAELTGVENFRLYAAATGRSPTTIEAYLVTPEGAADSAVWYMVRFGCLGIADPLTWRRKVAGISAPRMPIGWPNVQRLYTLFAQALGVRPAASPAPSQADALMAAEQQSLSANGALA